MEFDNRGRLSLVRANGVEVPVKQDILYYTAAFGEGYRDYNSINRSSGAYIFRPEGPLHETGKGNAEINVVEGSIVKEVHQKFSEWVSQVIRIYEDKSYVEFEWLVGPIPVEDEVGKEVVSKFKTNINSKGFFYTDSNGRDMMKRQRFHRENFDADFSDTAPSNYYPVTAKIALSDPNFRMAVLNDRAQGGSSLSDGSLELMVHRRLLYDDFLGVDEPLDEFAYGSGLIARGKHYLLVGRNNKQSIINERRLQLEVHLSSWKFFSTKPTFFEDLNNETNSLLEAFSALPENLNILTLEPWNQNQILLRLENILEKTEGDDILINLENICKQLHFLEITETTLDGAMWLSDLKRLKFTEDNEAIDKTSQEPLRTPFHATSLSYNEDFNIVLAPMSIRTFIIDIDEKVIFASLVSLLVYSNRLFFRNL